MYDTALESALLWARSPASFLGVALLHGAFDRQTSPIDTAPHSPVTVRVSQMNCCSFCVDLNSAMFVGLSQFFLRHSRYLVSIGAIQIDGIGCG